MSWGFLQETWPIEDGTELNSQHFEDLRLWLLLLDNLHTGYQLYNSGREYEAGDTCIMPSDGLLYQYNGASWIAVVPMTPSDTTTWEAFIDTIGYPGEKYSPSYDPGYGKVPAGWSVALDAVYWNYPGGTPDWYVMIDTQGLTRGQLKNNMPTDANGNLNNYWKHAVNPNKITSYDKNAERYIVQHTSGVIPNTSEDFFSIAYPAYRRAMQQTDSGKQEWPILYEDTERIMPHRKLNLEIKKEHITHNSTLGPNFTVEAFDVGVHVRSIVATKVVSGKNVGLAGYQYAIGVGSAEPDKNLPDVLEYYEGADSDQFYRDPKIRYALQNQIEWILSTRGWLYPTSHGKYYYWWHKIITNDAPGWDDSESYADGDGVVHTLGGQPAYFTCSNPSGSSGVEPTYGGSDWSLAAVMPDYAPMADYLWGCNESAFELALEITGDYDWWLDESYPYQPSRYVKDKVKDYRTDEEIPDPIATMRKTWKYSMGGPKSAYSDEKMWPSDHTWFEWVDDEPPGHSYPGTHYNGFPGIWLNSIPTITNTEEQQAVIDLNHGPVIDDGQALYERVRMLLNLCYDLLDISRYHETEPSLHFEDRMKYFSHDFTNDWGAWYNQAPAEMYVGMEMIVYEYHPPGSGNWYVYEGTFYELRLVADGPDWTNGQLIADSISVFLLFRMKQGGELVTSIPVELALPDGDHLTVPPWDWPDPPGYAFGSITCQINNSEPLYYYINAVGDVDTEPSEATAGHTINCATGFITSFGHKFFLLNLNNFDSYIFGSAFSRFTLVEEDDERFDDDGWWNPCAVAEDWQTGIAYEAGQYVIGTLVIEGVTHRHCYRCVQEHLSDSHNKPGTGDDWTAYWRRRSRFRPD